MVILVMELKYSFLTVLSDWSCTVGTSDDAFDCRFYSLSFF